jgi:hypothetical protein
MNLGDQLMDPACQQHGMSFPCALCDQEAALNEIMADVKMPAVIEQGISAADIYATVRAGKKVALTFDNYSEASEAAIKLQHHLQVLKSRDKKITSSLTDFSDFVIKFQLTTVGDDSAVLRRVVFFQDQPADVKRYSTFEIIE